MFDSLLLQSGGGKPPRDLEGLVKELVLSETEDTLWGTQFRQFLKQREKKDLEHALDFVTLSSRLSTVQDQAKWVLIIKSKEIKVIHISLPGKVLWMGLCKVIHHSWASWGILYV